MKKWMAIMLLIAIALFGSVIGFNLFKQKMIAQYMANRPEPEFPVTAMVTKAQDWVPTIEAIGFIEPNQGVTLSTELAGTIDAITFESGKPVKADQLLLSLDSTVERANLRASQAKLPAAKAKFDRFQNLYKTSSISKEQLDEAEAAYRSLEADIESLKATIARREVRAPFSGVVGLRNVFLGQYLQPGTDIVRLEDTSVMRLRFTVPQTDISKIKLGQTIKINVDAYPQTQFDWSYHRHRACGQLPERPDPGTGRHSEQRRSAPFRYVRPRQHHSADGERSDRDPADRYLLHPLRSERLRAQRGRRDRQRG